MTLIRPPLLKPHLMINDQNQQSSRYSSQVVKPGNNLPAKFPYFTPGFLYLLLSGLSLIGSHFQIR